MFWCMTKELKAFAKFNAAGEAAFNDLGVSGRPELDAGCGSANLPWGFGEPIEPWLTRDFEEGRACT